MRWAEVKEEYSSWLFAVALRTSQLDLHLWDYLNSELEARELPKYWALPGIPNKEIVSWNCSILRASKQFQETSGKLFPWAIGLNKVVCPFLSLSLWLEIFCIAWHEHGHLVQCLTKNSEHRHWPWLIRITQELIPETMWLQYNQAEVDTWTANRKLSWKG